MRKFRHQHGELVAAEASHHVAVAEHARHTGSHGLQDFVTRSMAEQIVDLLEAIEIETQHREHCAADARQRNLLVEPGVELAAVGEGRQGVVVREVTDMPLGFLARAQIAHRHDVMRLAAIFHRTQQHFDRYLRAVAVPQFGFDRLFR